MKFEIGQEVLCIKTHSQGAVVKGQKYPVIGIRQGCCQIVLDVGIVSTTTIWFCRNCQKTRNCGDNVWWLHSNLFAPIDNTLSEVTIEELIEQHEDI